MRYAPWAAGVTAGILTLASYCHGESPQTVSILNQFLSSDNAAIMKVADGIEFHKRKDAGQTCSRDGFAPPLEITAVVKCGEGDLRLYYAKGSAVVNRKAPDNSLYMTDPGTEDPHQIPDKGPVASDKFVTVRWKIDKDHTTLSVDGEERASFDGDYSKLSSTVAIGSKGKSDIVIKSLTVTSNSPPIEDAPPPTRASNSGAGGNPGAPSAPSAAAPEPPPPTSLETIENPAHGRGAKALVKSLATIHGMAVTIHEDGSETGHSMDILAVVPGDSRDSGGSSAVFVRKGEGEEMQTCFDEAIRAVKMRYPRWARGRIEVSFGDKYSPKDGGSAGTAFSVLLLSVLEGWQIDPQFAVTGDITVDWRVRQVGGIPAKLTGATGDGCKGAAIPESNESDIDDMRLWYGDDAVWKIQIFSIDTLQHACALLRTDRPAPLEQAIKQFAELQQRQEKLGHSWRGNAEIRKGLEEVLKLAPSHLSAKHLLAAMNGKAPSRLSEQATLEQYDSIVAPYKALASGKEPLNRVTFPEAKTIATRRSLMHLRTIADPDYLPLIAEFGRFAEMIDDVAAGKGTMAEVKTRFEALAAKESALKSK